MTTVQFLAIMKQKLVEDLSKIFKLEKGACIFATVTQKCFKSEG